jgi:hypothetical protein
MTRTEDTPQYQAGYQDGYQKDYFAAAQAAALPHHQAIERLKSDLAWALVQLEKQGNPAQIVEHIAWLRQVYRLDLVGGGVEQYRPQSHHDE